jgi:hypothetical protein
MKREVGCYEEDRAGTARFAGAPAVTTVVLMRDREPGGCPHCFSRASFSKATTSLK